MLNRLWLGGGIGPHADAWRFSVRQRQGNGSQSPLNRHASAYGPTCRRDTLSWKLMDDQEFQTCAGEALHDLYKRLNAASGSGEFEADFNAGALAIEFEEPQNALAALQQAGIKISKLHLSSALKAKPTSAAREKLKNFADDVYLHQVIARDKNGQLTFHRDLPDALKFQLATGDSQLAAEWRIHFHVPLHAPAAPPFENTNDHLLGVLDLLADNPKICSHLEMETYTWEVLPAELKSQDVSEQLAAEYSWTLAQLTKRGIGK